MNAACAMRGVGVKQQQQLVPLLLPLLLFLAITIHHICPAAAISVNVSNNQQLLQALESSNVDTIVLQNDVALGPEFEVLETSGQPLQITRNVTVTGPAGANLPSNSSIDSTPLIDLQGRVGIFDLCSSCLFTFLGVSLANDNRAGTQGGTSAFRGQPGSRLDWVTGVGLRSACPPTRQQLPLINATQRSALFPSPSGRQRLAVTNFTYRGVQYRDMLHVDDLSLDVVPQQISNDSFTGGYASRRQNVTRLCEHIVSAVCLQSRLPEDCIAEAQAGSRSSAATAAAGDGGHHLAVDIAVPLAVAAALLLLGAGVWVWRRRRRRQRKLTPPTPKPDSSLLPRAAPDAAAGALAPASPAMGAATTTVVAAPSVARAAPAQPLDTCSNSSLAQQTQPLLGGSGRWQVLWSSSPGFGAAGHFDIIELGVLLGAGSFARVYRGRWSGLDVAVKVITHDLDSAPNVIEHAQLKLALNHPNIIRAYYCITKQMLPAAATAAAAAASAQQPLSPAAAGNPAAVAPQPAAAQPDPAAAGGQLGAAAAAAAAASGSAGRQAGPVSCCPAAAADILASSASTSSSSSNSQWPTSPSPQPAAATQLWPSMLSTSTAGSAMSPVLQTPAAMQDQHGPRVLQPLQPLGTAGQQQLQASADSAAAAAAAATAAVQEPPRGFVFLPQGAAAPAGGSFTTAAGTAAASQQQQQQPAATSSSLAMQPITPNPSVALAARNYASSSSRPAMGASSALHSLGTPPRPQGGSSPAPAAAHSGSGSGWGSQVQDLDASSLPAYQRKLRPQLTPLQSGAPSEHSRGSSSSPAGPVLLLQGLTDEGGPTSQQGPGSRPGSYTSLGSGSTRGSLPAVVARGRVSVPGSPGGAPAWGLVGPSQAPLADALRQSIEATVAGSSLGGGAAGHIGTSVQGVQQGSMGPGSLHSTGSGAAFSSPRSLAAPGASSAAASPAAAGAPVLLPLSMSAVPWQTAAVGSGLGSSSNVSINSSNFSAHSLAWPILNTPVGSAEGMQAGTSPLRTPAAAAAAGVGSAHGGSWDVARSASPAGDTAAASGGTGGGGITASTGGSTGAGSLLSSVGGGQPGAGAGSNVDPAVMLETWLVLELCDRGTLARQSLEWRPASEEGDMLRLLHLLLDVARGLKLLKDQNVVHADLNAHNVLVASSPVAPYGLVAKVADLGLARVLGQATHGTTRTVGTLTHQPPELLRDGRMSPAVDIYSFGIMMFEVFTHKVPFARLRYGQVYHQVVVLGARPEVPPDMPEDYELLMKSCWAAEASERPNIDMVIQCLGLMIDDRQAATP